MAPTLRLWLLATAPPVLLGAFVLAAVAQQRPDGAMQEGQLSGREQREELRRASALLGAARRLAEDGRTEDAKARFDDAKARVDAVAADVDERITRMFERTREQLEKSHADLVAAGVPLDSLDAPPEGDAPADRRGMAADPRARAEPPTGRGGRMQPGGVSFVAHVAPVLLQRCGACHVREQRGEVSFASYDALMRGTRGRQVVVPGRPEQSLMIQLIESGDMPRGGGSVPPQELQLLQRWIGLGAQFDGDNPSSNLQDLRPTNAAARGGQPAAEMTGEPEVARPMGDETVSFAADVATVLLQRCAQCHVQDDQGGLSMATFTTLLAGGDGGPIITPGAPDQSPLVRRIRGDDTPRMPPRGPAVPAEEIEKIATWVREGAKFDGERASDSLERTFARGAYQRFTPDQLNLVRRQTALSNWRLALPDEPSATHESQRVLVVGAAPEDELAAVARAAEATAGQVLEVFGGAPEDPLGKARVTLFVFGDRVDYGEFATMVEKRRLPDDAPGHWRYNVVDCYACLPIDAGGGGEGVDALSLAHQLAAAYLAERTIGGAPHWLVDGAARVAAAHTDPRNPQVRAWLDEARQHAAGMNEASDFMTGKLSPEASGLVGFSFTAPLMRQEARFLQVIDAIGQGKSVDEAFEATYGRPSGELAELWRASLASGR